MGTQSSRSAPATPELVVHRVFDAEGKESTTLRVRCPDCRRRLVMRENSIRDFLEMSLSPTPGTMPSVVSSASRPVRERPMTSNFLPTVTVGELMVRDVVCVRPETSIEELRSILLGRGISGVPVVDRDGRLVGVVSKTDLVREAQDTGEESGKAERLHTKSEDGYDVDLGPGFHAEDIPEGTVAEIMTPYALALPARATVLQAAAIMAYEGVHRLVVVEDQDVVGILTATDVLGWLAREFGWAVPPYTRNQRGQRGTSS